jgi:hypothetical protein
MPVIQGVFGPARPFVPAVIAPSRSSDRQRGTFDASVTGIMLLDSGSELSCIHETAARQIGLADRGSRQICGIGGPVHVFQYRIRLGLIASAGGKETEIARDLLVVEDCSDWPITFAGVVIGIVGMDVLASMHLLLDGPNKRFALTVAV